MKKLTMEELGRNSVESFKEKKKHPVVVVLDNIRSMNNVGSAFRTSDAFLIEEIHLCGITAKPPHREIHKTALGATESVDWKYFSQTTDALKELKEQGYKVLAVEQTTKSMSLETVGFEKDEKIAFVFGNEAFGVSDEALAECDASVEIPQFGTKHSLNISVCIGVILWQYLSKTLG